jgi:hypothetical protein
MEGLQKFLSCFFMICKSKVKENRNNVCESSVLWMVLLNM